jgi:hypothetical protein
VKTKAFYGDPIVTTLTVIASVEGRSDLKASFEIKVTILPQKVSR